MLNWFIAVRFIILELFFSFFSSTPTITGYKMWQMFSFQHNKLDVIKLMKRKNQAIMAYEDYVWEISVPNYTVTDDSAELIG